MTDATRLIELEHEVVATRKAAVAIIHHIVQSCDTLDTDAVVDELERRAEGAPVAEARLARLVAETLRRL